MSRLIKYLHQTCQYEAAENRKADGTVELNRYGEVEYSNAIQLKCRVESYTRDLQTSTGAIVHSTKTYFLGPGTEVFVDDRLDGHVVLSVQDYVDLHGNREGFEAYV